MYQIDLGELDCLAAKDAFQQRIQRHKTKHWNPLDPEYIGFDDEDEEDENETD